MIRSIGRIMAMLLKIGAGLLAGALLLLLASTTGLRAALDVASNLSNQSIRYQHVSGRLLGHVELDGFAGCLVGGVLDLVGVARVRQDLNHERACR